MAAWPCRLRGVRQRGLFKPLIWPESARQREPRERGQGFRVPVCACAVIVGVCMPCNGERPCVYSVGAELKLNKRLIKPTCKVAAYVGVAPPSLSGRKNPAS